MFREMRRKRQLLNDSESIALLKRGTSGVLALAGDDGYPYALPISYVYSDGKLYFHSAKSGHKIDAVNKCDKASFCVIDQDQIVPERYTTYFKSVVAFGKIRVLERDDEIRAAIRELAGKYHPEDSESNREQVIDKEYQAMCMLELSIEHMTGKQAKELVEPSTGPQPEDEKNSSGNIKPESGEQA